MRPQTKTKLLLGIPLAAIAAFGIYYALFVYGHANTRQEMIHEMGGSVMPFSLGKTQHIFKKTETGGVQSVVVRDAADTENLSFIRMHLQMEAGNFSRGDFSDPTGLHGEDMSGLSVLQANYSKIQITYSEIENGAQIDFETSDAGILAAIHTWFDAQVSDHGSDASAQ